jgi:predicted permease
MRMVCVRNRQDGIDAEIENHVAMHTEDGVRAGLEPDEARRQALVRLGGAEQTRQAWRERNSLPWLDNLLRDVRYALRGFGRNPAFTVTVIATLALGIGATTAVFSVVDRILFRSLPYANDERLVSLGLSQSLEKQEFTLGGFFYEWRDNQRPFEAVTFEQGVGECNLTEGNPLHLHCGLVAGGFLSTLGVALQIGRNFLPQEDEPNGPKSAIISDALWLGRYNRDPGVLHRTIDVDDRAIPIVGVLPKNFEMPRLQSVDLLFPAQMDPAVQHTVNSGIGYPMWAFARLKPGVSVAQAKADMEPLYLHTQQWIPPQIRQDFHLQVRSIRDRQMQDAYMAARILLGAVFAVLLIACANVGSLFSARGAVRERELAVRSALGASRGRLIRQTMTEALVLAGAGLVAGCLLAEALLRAFVSIAPSGIPFLAKAQIDLRIIVFSLLVSLVCVTLFGILPAMEKPRTESLVSRSTLSQGHASLRRILVAVQIAVSVVLLTGASLLVKSFRNLESQTLGMSTRNVLALHVPLTWQRYPSTQAIMDFYLRTETALKHVPGVTAVVISDSIPPDADSWHDARRYADLHVDGKQAAPEGVNDSVVRRMVTPSYFRVLQIPLIEGRDFQEEERTIPGSPMILSRLLASRLFPGVNPVGKHIQFGTFNPYFALEKAVYTVIGVAADVRNDGLANQDLPEFYELRGNQADDWNNHNVILLESETPVGTVAPWIRSQIARIDPTVPVDIAPLSESVSKLADRPRFETALVGFFAACGLMMAVIGLYGVIAFIATQRTHEIGVRMALGASRADILRLIAGEGARLIVLGGVLGLAAAIGTTRLLKSLLFQVGPHDPVSFVAVAVLLALLALAATLLPARAAMKIDPIGALRCE